MSIMQFYDGENWIDIDQWTRLAIAREKRDAAICGFLFGLFVGVLFTVGMILLNGG